MIGNREIAAADAIEKRELLEAWRAVANAKLAEFRRQCWRLSMLVRGGALSISPPQSTACTKSPSLTR